MKVWDPKVRTIVDNSLSLFSSLRALSSSGKLAAFSFPYLLLCGLLLFQNGCLDLLHNSLPRSGDSRTNRHKVKIENINKIGSMIVIPGVVGNQRGALKSYIVVVHPQLALVSCSWPDWIV